MRIDPEPVIETRGLRRVFKSRQREVVAVAGVDLLVKPGEIFGFLGPNGAGKDDHAARPRASGFR